MDERNPDAELFAASKAAPAKPDFLKRMVAATEELVVRNLVPVTNRIKTLEARQAKQTERLDKVFESIARRGNGGSTSGLELFFTELQTYTRSLEARIRELEKR